MKRKHRILTLLLAAAMLATFLPTAVFAGSGDWEITGGREYSLDLKEDSIIELGVTYSGEAHPALEYMLQKNGKTYTRWTALPAPGEGGYVGVQWESAVLGVGAFTFTVREKSDPGIQKQSRFNIGSAFAVWKGGIRYGFSQIGSGTVAVLGGKTKAGNDLSGDVKILDEVCLANGKTYKVKRIEDRALYQIQRGRVRTVTIPPTIKIIGESAFGANPRFTVIGKKKSAAEKYAKAHGLTFKASNNTTTDKDWLGTLDKKMPTARGVKAVAGKKNIKVNWNKLDAASLKKFATVEVQVCPDKNFARKNSVRKSVRKSVLTLTVKNLKSKKTYYVRVRNVKGSGKTKQVSRWSSVKTVKVK